MDPLHSRIESVAEEILGDTDGTPEELLGRIEEAWEDRGERLRRLQKKESIAAGLAERPLCNDDIEFRFGAELNRTDVLPRRLTVIRDRARRTRERARDRGRASSRLRRRSRRGRRCRCLASLP